MVCQFGMLEHYGVFICFYDMLLRYVAILRMLVWIVCMQLLRSRAFESFRKFAGEARFARGKIVPDFCP